MLRIEFKYELQDRNDSQQSQGKTFLSTNGLGGYCSVDICGGVSRCDQGILISAERIPNHRVTLVHRLRDRIVFEGKEYFLSSQKFADGREAEVTCLQQLSFGTHAVWSGRIGHIQVVKECGAAWECNAAAVSYQIRNDSGKPCILTVEPMLKMAPKEEARQTPCDFDGEGSLITADGWKLFIRTNGELIRKDSRWETLSYPEDQKDGRPGEGLAGSCCEIGIQIPARTDVKLEIVFSQNDRAGASQNLFDQQDERLNSLKKICQLKDSVAQQLAMASDAYITQRESTAGKTILAGYPLFSDWGRDTMIALRGCCLAAKRFEDAKSILKTFMKYEKDGLMPNLFPEGGQEPMYNTVDAALLFIDSIWQYYCRTRDLDFVIEAWPVMSHIIEGYWRGTHHGIKMDEDGLISAGEGFDQVTWMDVRIGDILPTPRHGKPVEVNAYWYNALKIMENLGSMLGKEIVDYEKLSQKVKNSFLKKFYLKDKKYLKDVLSGTKADDQIRCNQIWAVSVAFSMLNEQQQREVVETVRDHLFTDHGLRSLSPEDPEYHPYYGGDQLSRDLAYHQGTVWVFPLGAFYLAYLKAYHNSKQAVLQVRSWLSSMDAMLREGCAGQLPEIYDGKNPGEGKGCFGQAWSVGEMLMVYEALEAIEGNQ